MKLLLKLNVYALAVLLLTSCLKEKNDVGGMLTDEGSILTTIAEVDYIAQDNHVIGFGYYPLANFPFTTGIPNEMVKFFTIHVSQPRKTKLSGPLKLTITMTSTGGDPIPAGAITIPATVDFPAFTSEEMDFPVKFAVNKSLLSAGGDYAAEFHITATNQGAVSANSSSIEVFFLNSAYYGRYNVEETVIDPANVIKMDKNIKPVLLDNPGYLNLYIPGTFQNPAGARNLVFIDEYYNGLTFNGSAWNTNSFSTLVNNLTTGTTSSAYALLFPTYGLDANDNLIRVTNSLTGANYNVTLNSDAPNKYVYTANDDRTFHISYNVTLTAPLPSGSSSRIFKVTDKFTYHKIQVRVF